MLQLSGRRKGQEIMIIMAIYSLLMAAFIISRVILPLKLRKVWKLALSLFIMAACCKNQITHLLGGPMFFAPDLPGWFLLPAAWVYASAFLLFCGLVVMEIIRLAVKLVYFCRKQRKLPEKTVMIFQKINLGLIVLAAIFAAIGLYRGMADPAVREITLHFANLPKEADGCRIAVLADLHADRITTAPRIRRMTDLANSLNPDLTVLLGDYVDGKVPARGRELLPLKSLKSKYGVYAIPGNHEYYSGWHEWRPFLNGCGLKILENSHVRLPNGIFLAGVSDPAARGFGEPVPDLAKALHKIPSGQFILLLAHRPGESRNAARAGVSLQLSGHTHGGMVYGLDWVVGRFNGGFVTGLYEVGGMKLYVSNGTGIWNGFPIRLGHGSELTLITLRSR